MNDQKAAYYVFSYLHMMAFQFTYNYINASTDASPGMVKVCDLDVLTQEQYLVPPLWEKICPLLIHSLTSNGEKPLTVHKCRRGC